MELKSAYNAKLVIEILEENDRILKLLGDAKGKVKLYYEDNSVTCLTINTPEIKEKIISVLREHYEQHNKHLYNEIKEL